MEDCTQEGEGEVAASGLLLDRRAPGMLSTTIQVEIKAASNATRQYQSNTKTYI